MHLETLDPFHCFSQAILHVCSKFRQNFIKMGCIIILLVPDKITVKFLDLISAGISDLSYYSQTNFLRGAASPHNLLRWPPREFSPLPLFF